jgi:hypothetical protein
VVVLSENTQHWLGRLREEIGAISDAGLAVAYAMQLAEVELAHGLDAAARATLIRGLQRFDVLHPGAWTSLVYCASQLCARFSENALLQTEVQRGVAWLAQPEIVEYQGDLRERVHDFAIQAGSADVAAELISNEWPGERANRLVDRCRLAGWAQDAAKLRRTLSTAREAIAAAGPGPDHLRTPLGYWLARACVRAGLLGEASELCGEFGFPLEATDELLIALWAATHPGAYAAVRDGWLTDRIRRFEAATKDHHFCSTELRHCAETLRRLGDADGYRNARRQYHEVVAMWTPSRDWIACYVHCDLAVLYAKAAETDISAEHFSAAKRLFDGKVPGVPTARGSRSLMASILSAGHRDVDDTDLAVRFARRSSDARDRQLHLVSALIVGGRVSDAEAELARLGSPDDRADLIGYSLLTWCKVGSLPVIIVPDRL